MAKTASPKKYSVIWGTIYYAHDQDLALDAIKAGLNRLTNMDAAEELIYLDVIDYGG